MTKTHVKFICVKGDDERIIKKVLNGNDTTSYIEEVSKLLLSRGWSYRIYVWRENDLSKWGF